VVHEARLLYLKSLGGFPAVGIRASAGGSLIAESRSDDGVQARIESCINLRSLRDDDASTARERGIFDNVPGAFGAGIGRQQFTHNGGILRM
jgi:hypothetical protein